MKAARSTLSVFGIACSCVFPLLARKILVPSYRQLLERSDLVVIATPTTRTTDTAESTSLPGTQVPSVGVETSFKVSAVLKGGQGLQTFVLHHYREAVAERGIDGFNLLFFDPSIPSKRGSYLLFLMREPDGRYAPTGGQTDPGYVSVHRLR